MAVKSIAGKKTGWKIYVIILGVVIVAAGAVFIWTTFQNIRNINKYEEVLSNYFKLKSEDNKAAINLIVSADFEDDLASINLKGSGYILYSYDFTEESVSSSTNEGLKTKKITFGITLKENNLPVSYVGEAYLIDEDNGIKIHYIKKLYRGRNITKLWSNNPVKV